MSTLILFCLLSLLLAYLAFKMLKHIAMALITFLIVFALSTAIYSMFNMKEIQQSPAYLKVKGEMRSFVNDIDKGTNRV